METMTKVGIFFLFLFLSFGIYQSFNQELPQSSLAGAAVLEPRSQEQINGCMKECMRECVTDQVLVVSCTTACETRCL